jgi:hypothetical protein
MIFFRSTTDKLQLTTTTTANVDVVVSYVDRDQATGDLADGRQLTTISSATNTDICAAPSSGDTRKVKLITVRNRHASNPNVVTIRYDANGSFFQIHSENLAAGDELTFIEGVGFSTNRATTAVSTPASLLVASVASQVDNATTTLAKITAIDVALGTGTYHYKYYVRHQAAALTTGIRLSVNYTGSTTSHVWQWGFVDTAATAATAVPDQDVVTATGSVMSWFASRASSTTSRGTSLSVDTTSADCLAIVEGLIVTSGAGDLQLWHASEVAFTSSIMPGTSVQIIQVA